MQEQHHIQLKLKKQLRFEKETTVEFIGLDKTENSAPDVVNVWTMADEPSVYIKTQM